MSRINKGATQFRPIAKPKPSAGGAPSISGSSKTGLGGPTRPAAGPRGPSSTPTQRPAGLLPGRPSTAATASAHDGDVASTDAVSAGRNITQASLMTGGLSAETETTQTHTSTAPPASALIEPSPPSRPVSLHPPAPSAPIAISAVPVSAPRPAASTAIPLSLPSAPPKSRPPTQPITLTPSEPHRPTPIREPTAPVPPSARPSRAISLGDPSSMAPPQSRSIPPRPVTRPQPSGIDADAVARSFPPLAQSFGPAAPDPLPRTLPDGSVPSVLMEEAPAAESSSTATNKGRPPTGTRKKRRAKDPVEHTDEVDGEAQPAPAKKKRAAPRKKTADGVVDGDGSAEPAKKRPRKKATPQRSQREQSGSAEVDSDDEDLGDFSAEGPGPDASRAARKRKRYTVIANDAVDDPDAIEPGQALGPAIDEAEWTMADIAMHPGEGRVSKRGLELQKKKAEMLKEKKEKERERLLRLESLAEEGGDGAGPEEVEEIGDVNTDGGTTNATPAPAAPPVDFFNAPAIGEIGGPQLRVVNGELVIDQESLVIDQRARALAAADSMEVITETDQDRFVNASSYQRKPKGARWTAEETELFLQKVSEFGTDFQMIAYCFPGRSRNMIKNKYNRESQLYGGRLEEALATRKPVDMDYLSVMTKTDFSAPLEEIVDESALDLGEDNRAVSPGGAKEGSPSRSSRAGSASTLGPLQRGRANSMKKRRRSRSAMEEGVEIIGEI